MDKGAVKCSYLVREVIMLTISRYLLCVWYYVQISAIDMLLNTSESNIFGILCLLTRCEQLVVSI